MHMIRDDGQRTLHGFAAQVEMPCSLVSGGSWHGDKAREAVSVDDHLDEVFEL